MRIYITIMGIIFAGSLAGMLAILLNRASTGAPGPSRAPGGGLIITGGQSWRENPLRQPTALSGMDFPAFDLVDQNGRRVDRSLFEGQLSVAGFMFSHCRLACPVMMAFMKQLADELRGLPVRFVGISIDPENDTPERLRQWAQEQALDLGRWTLLTEPPGRPPVQWARTMLAERWKYAPITEDERPESVITLEDGRTVANLLHPADLFLIGPRGEVLGRYHVGNSGGLEFARLQVRELGEHARAAAERLTAQP